MIPVDLKADILGMIAGEFGTAQVDNEIYLSEFEDHEEPAVLLDVFKMSDLGNPSRKPICRVRIDVTVEEIDDR